MSLFDKIFGSKKESSFVPDSFFQTLNAYTPAFTTWGGNIYESELVRSAINAKASHISKMSVKLRGNVRKDLQKRFSVAPNDFQTWSQFLYRLSTILDVNNTAFIVPVIDKYDVTTGVYPVLPERCEIVQYANEPYLRYTFINGQTASIELARCGMMTKFQYKNDFMGDANDALNNTMALIDIQDQAIKEGVKSSATFRFMAQMNNFVKPDDLAKERRRFTRENLDDGGGFLLFPSTYSNVRQIESKPFVVDADQMKLINTNVYNYFGVNEKIMQNSADAEALDAFYNGSLEPFAIQLSDVLTRMLFTQKEIENGAKVIAANDKLQYMSIKDKLSMIETLGDRGMFTINEARELINYEPVAGGDSLMPIRGEYYNASADEKGHKDAKEVNDDGEGSKSV